MEIPILVRWDLYIETLPSHPSWMMVSDPWSIIQNFECPWALWVNHVSHASQHFACWCWPYIFSYTKMSRFKGWVTKDLYIKFSINNILHYAKLPVRFLQSMMTSSNGNIFCVTGPLWGEFTGLRWIPLTKASDVELWYFFDRRPHHQNGLSWLPLWSWATYVLLELCICVWIPSSSY